MSEWNAMTYEGKDTILRVVRREADDMFALAEQPGAWDAPTACESWRVKDVIGHIVDTTEGYFRAFDAARAGAEAPAPHGLGVMHERAGRSAQAFGKESQQEMLSRARADLDKMMGILEPLTADEWTGMLVPHAYMGPVPAFVYAGGQLMDYGVHTWDIRQGTRPGARPVGRRRRPAGAVHVHHLAVDDPRPTPTSARSPSASRSAGATRATPGVDQRRRA